MHEKQANGQGQGDITEGESGRTVNSPSGDRLLTSLEAAEFLGLAVDHKAPSEAVRFLCRRRKLKFLKVGRGLRFRKRWLEEFIEREAVDPV